MLQHITDPQICIGCSACELACSLKAIECVVSRYCINCEVCQDCRKCIEACPTGAADCFIEVKQPYSIDEQSAWTIVPQQEN